MQYVVTARCPERSTHAVQVCCRVIRSQQLSGAGANTRNRVHLCRRRHKTLNVVGQKHASVSCTTGLLYYARVLEVGSCCNKRLLTSCGLRVSPTVMLSADIHMRAQGHRRSRWGIRLSPTNPKCPSNLFFLLMHRCDRPRKVAFTRHFLNVNTCPV